jgi:cardiolipin synthase
MDMHRTTGKADWAEVAPASRNVWQKLAVATRGLATPGNIVTVVGFAIVVYGLSILLLHQYWLGLLLIGAGRALDILDGIVAEATGTKSPLGEAFDATFDKLGTAATLVIFGIAGIAPWWVLALIPYYFWTRSPLYVP